NGSAPPTLVAERAPDGRFLVGNKFAVGKPLGSIGKLNRLARQTISQHGVHHLLSALDETRQRFPHLYVKFMLQYFRPYQYQIEADEEANEFRDMHTPEEVLDALHTQVPELLDLLKTRK